MQASAEVAFLFRFAVRLTDHRHRRWWWWRLRDGPQDRTRDGIGGVSDRITHHNSRAQLMRAATSAIARHECVAHVWQLLPLATYDCGRSRCRHTLTMHAHTQSDGQRVII